MSRKYFYPVLMLISTMIFAAGNAHAAGGCTANDVKARWGSASSTTMTVPAGGTCRQSIKFGKNKGGSIKGITVSKKPAHGSVSASGYQWVYKAKPGYAGADAFEVSAEGGDTINAGTSVISVNVTVQ